MPFQAFEISAVPERGVHYSRTMLAILPAVTLWPFLFKYTRCGSGEKRSTLAIFLPRCPTLRSESKKSTPAKETGIYFWLRTGIAILRASTFGHALYLSFSAVRALWRSHAKSN